MTNFLTNIKELQAKYNNENLHNLRKVLNLSIDIAIGKGLLSKKDLKGYYLTPMLDDESQVLHQIISIPEDDYDEVIDYFIQTFNPGDTPISNSQLRNDYDQGCYVSFSTPCEVIQFFPCDAYLHIIYICTGQF